MHTFAERPPQGSAPVNLRMVSSGPAPRRVTLLLPLKVMPLDSVYVPSRRTTTPLRQAAMALLIAVAVAPGASVAHTVVRCGISPLTPARLQSTVRWASALVKVCACDDAGRPTRRKRNRTRVITLIDCGSLLTGTDDPGRFSGDNRCAKAPESRVTSCRQTA